MPSTRLATWMREALEKKLIQHRFSPAVMDLIAARAELAGKVYDDVFSAGLRVRMDELPKGWLPEVYDIDVKFGDDFTELRFDGGGLYGELSKAQAEGDRASVSVRPRRRIPFSVKGAAAKVYDIGHPLQREFEGLKQDLSKLKAQIVDAGSVISGTLSSFTTVNALIKGWPEVEPFARVYLAEPVSLPVVPRATLNTLLDLPAEEIAHAGS